MTNLEFLNRNVVCLSQMAPAALDLDAFERSVGLSRAGTQHSDEQLALAEYPKLRLLLTPDQRLTAETRPNKEPDRDTCRRIAAEVIRQSDAYLLRGVGFNGMIRMTWDGQESNPLDDLIDRDQVQARLGRDVEQQGLVVVYREGLSRVTVTIAPEVDEPRVMMATINRHLVLPAGRAEIEDGISFFAALNDEWPKLMRRLLTRDSKFGEGDSDG